MKLCFEQTVDAARDALFAFHADPANLAALLEGWKGFRLLAHEGHIRPPSRVRVRQTVCFVQHEMTFEHFVFEPGLRFGERQVHGPFARFEHTHEFSDAPRGTTIVDRVDFALPWRLGGPIADRCVVAPALRRFFEFRRAAYQRLCESGRMR